MGLRLSCAACGPLGECERIVVLCLWLLGGRSHQRNSGDCEVRAASAFESCGERIDHLASDRAPEAHHPRLRHRIAVLDTPRGGCVRDARTARVQERERHRLRAFVVDVVEHFDLDGLRGLAGGEGEVARLGHVVFACGCGAVARRVVDGDVGSAFAVECHREGERRPFLLAHRRVGDRDGHRPQNRRAHRPFNHPSGFGAHRAGLPARRQRRVEREGHGHRCRSASRRCRTRWLCGGVTLRAPVMVPPVTSNIVSRTVL